MQVESDSIYGTMPASFLLAHEVAALDSLLAGIYGQFGLYIKPQSLRTTEPAHRLTRMITLHMDMPKRLAGSLHCTTDQLPFASDSFKLILVQHAAESVATPEFFSAELARVLAPEGVALILGFNTCSAWRPWLALQQRRMSGSTLHLQSPRLWATQLARYDIEVMQTHYLGPFLPHVSNAPTMQNNTVPSLHWFTRFRGAYVLLARKRRSTLTPLRLRKPQRKRALPPYFAPGARCTPA